MIPITSYKEKWEFELNLGFIKSKIKLRNEPNTRSHRDGNTKTLLGCGESVGIENRKARFFYFLGRFWLIYSDSQAYRR
jgi:hypothetical protein